MAMKVFVPASEAWSYFNEHKEELKISMHKIAGNEEFGVEVFITEAEEYPIIVVTADGEEVWSEEAVSKSDCENSLKRVYDIYLTSSVLDTLAGSDDDRLSDLEIEDTIMEREDELSSAVFEFIEAVAPNEFEALVDNIDEAVEDIKDHFLEYLARKYGFRIYRPMFLEYDDGVEEFTEYPYEDMVFDDEDNPVYKHE